MVSPVPKRIAFFTHLFDPGKEAVSKEIEALSRSLESTLVFVAGQQRGIYLRRGVFSFYAKLYPLKFSLPLMERAFSLSHIFTPPNDLYFLSILMNSHLILTVTSLAPLFEPDFYEKVKNIIVECKRDQEYIISAGIVEDKVELIYPGIKLDNFSYGLPRGGRFSLLFASSPFEKKHFQSRGIRLLLEAAKRLSNIEFLILWRGRYRREISNLVRGLKNVKVVNQRIEDANLLYSKVYATVLPFTTVEDNKSCPHSVIESLSSGRPVLVSERVGVASLVEEKGCGVVFPPQVDSLVASIRKLERNYDKYQKVSRSCAEEYFSHEKFIEGYKGIYRKVLEE